MAPNNYKKLIDLKFAALKELGYNIDAIRCDYEQLCTTRNASSQAEVCNAFWDAADKQKQVRGLPQLMAQSVPFGALGLIDYLTASAADVEGFFQQLQQQLQKVVEFIDLEIVDERDRIAVYLHSFDQYRSTKSLEFMRCLIVQRLRRALPAIADELLKTETEQEIAVDEQASAEKKSTKASSALVVALTKPNVKKELTSADPYLHQILVHSLLNSEPAPKSNLNIILAIRKKLRTGEVSPHKIASDLGMSERTMQRRLAEIGQSFRGVCDDFCHEQALKLLNNDALTLTQIAIQLGYADLVSFGRAFKRWTGQGPGAWRKEKSPKKKTTPVVKQPL